ncbi:hypothetical protein ES703_87820 [subsurface metagenome]
MKRDSEMKVIIPKRRHEETLTYRVVVTDRNGKVLDDISAPSRSYVKQWNQILNVQADQTTETIKDITGANRTIEERTSNLEAKYALYGVRVGKGSTPVTINDYKLEAACGAGTGVDQFNHQANYYTVPAVVGSTCSFTLKRTLINNSGAIITGVIELGVYVEMYGTDYLGLGFRDVLGAGVDVPDGGAITVEYTIGVTV